jgi:hypothetical protein
MHDDRSVLEALLGDGRFLLALSGVLLALGGWFAILQSAAGHFLPHDVHALGYDAAQLADAANPKLVQFMFHDRVAFGGTLLSIGFAYWWLAEFPLKARAAWAWWTFCLSGLCGFASFLSYLGYGYLDTWHGVATLFLLPVFLCGLWRARPPAIALGDVWRSSEPLGGGRLLLALVALGLVCGGVTIMIVGMTSVFVPQDLTFMELTREQIRGMSPRLVPVIAHDRSGFGGGLFSMGVILALMARHAPITRSFVQIVTLMGVAGFGATLGVHFAIGYTDVTHLAPAYVGCALFLAALVRLARASLSPLVDAAQPPTADRRGS